MQIALSTHLFLEQPLDEDLLRLIKSNGFSCLEIWGMRPHFDYYRAGYVAALARRIKRLGMQVAAVHAPFYAHLEQARAGQWLSISGPNPAAREAAQAEILALLKALPILNCSLLVVHPGGLADRAERSLQENVKKSIQILLEDCAPQGIRIALENINSELGSPQGVSRLVEEIAAPNLGMCLDLGHANLVEDLPALVKKAAAKLIHIHASDNNGQEDSHQIPFEGSIDWQKVQDVLQGVDYQGCLAWELRSTGSPADVLSKIYANSGKIFPFSSPFPKIRA